MSDADTRRSRYAGWERIGSKVSLHGLGFLQVELTPILRLHVWHPDLPTRRYAAQSNVHDHRFGFDSTVLAGTQVNHVLSAEEVDWDTEGIAYAPYQHTGPRSKFGNRPWVPSGPPLRLIHHDTQVVEVGETYHMRPYIFHRTEPGNSGKVATLMRKTSEGTEGATSTCLVGVMPDVDFDRFQLDDDEAWRIIRDVLGD